jgi:hypothetical protein
MAHPAMVYSRLDDQSVRQDTGNKCMNKQRVIPYMVGNYAELVEDHSYF